MTQTVAMIRAMALLPAVRWLRDNNRSIEPLLSACGLSRAPCGSPLDPIPLLNVGRLLTAIARSEGPDIPWRIVTSANDAELALIGYVALGTSSPIEALGRIAAALPMFCSHEHLALHLAEEVLVVRHSYAVRFDAETEHLMLQYAVAMSDRICAMTGARSPRRLSVEMPPHPEAGFDHLAPWLGHRISPRADHSICVTIPREVAERPFLLRARDRLASGGMSDFTPLRGDGTLSDSARIMIAAMIENDLPRIEDLAAAAGMSVRTLQRRLKAEGTSFSALLASAREEQARQRLAQGGASVASIASGLGYSRQSSLTRAVRRWTGQPPSLFRKNPRS